MATIMFIVSSTVMVQDGGNKQGGTPTPVIAKICDLQPLQLQGSDSAKVISDGLRASRFNAELSLAATDKGLYAAFAWPVLASSSFIEP